MAFKKSFNLNKVEKKAKSTEKLYRSKKFRWCKYVSLSPLVGFILLLILTNVDFTGEAYSQEGVQTNFRINSIDETIKTPLKKTNIFLSRTVGCIALTDKCTLTCSGGNVNNLYKHLETLYKLCQRDLDLCLFDCSIPSGRIKYDFFVGNYRLKSININNCTLNAIESAAFREKSVRNLRNLTLIKTQFVSLDASSFDGLSQLEQFYLMNKISGSTFKGDSFLTPFAKSLKSLAIRQEGSRFIPYDALRWLQGNKMKSLKNVTLSHNNFGAQLKQKTFSTLINVEYLDLSNNGLIYLPANTFAAIKKTLKYLDLSSNELKVLAGEMLFQTRGFELNLSFNKWDCSCKNKDMLQIIQRNLVDIVYKQRSDMKCYAPYVKRNLSIDEVKFDCVSTTTYENGKSTDHTMAVATTKNVANQISISSLSESSSSSSSDSTSSRETSNEKLTLYCRSLDNRFFTHTIVRNKFKFSIETLSATDVKVLIPTDVEYVGILYFSNARDVMLASGVRGHHYRYEYDFAINNLNPKLSYVFCVLEPRSTTSDDWKAYDWIISPLDCRSYSRREVRVHSWLEKEDQVWIISLVVLGTCLMILLGIILSTIFMRWRKRNAKKHRRTLNGYEIDAAPMYPHVQPPDVVGQNANSSYNLYEELIM